MHEVRAREWLGGICLAPTQAQHRLCTASLASFTQPARSVQHVWHLLRRLCAPREVVLLRTWRKDDDGTYIVLYQSTKHRAVPVSKGWGGPVRVQVWSTLAH